ncbi:MAG TPA: ATP-dependent Clp protease proteolytic subunit [Candidatus Limnocylindria bacterium]|nr:ATP-dependent Clp protease proteolytic subunit [Candidatus Limnocylindria bacterium]
MLEILWLFIILSSLQPVLKQRWLESQRMRAFRELERERKSRVIGLIHRQETLRLLGFPLSRYIDIEDSEQLLRAIQLTGPDVPIDLILHTPGGLVLAAEQIAKALRRHPATVTVFVPHYAMSGGTLIALAADEIVMAENAVLGPVDPQLGQSPAASIVRVLERKPIAEIDDQTIVLADVAEKALRQVSALVRDLLAERMGRERALRLAKKLASGTWTHDYPISPDEARELGIPVSTEMPSAIFDLMHLYPQTTQRRPSVEYIPMPYGSREAPQDARRRR